jgi:alpha-glucoside transport system substrate-binding protein
MGHFSAGPRLRSMALGVGAVLLLAACGGGGGTTGSSTSNEVTVWTAWGGQELKAFKDVLKPFEDKTGYKVRITTVRDASQLAINVDAGTTLPDIAAAPTPDKVADWVQKGVMKPLEGFLDMNSYLQNTYPALTANNIQNGVVNGKHYEMFVKTQVKGLFWFNKKAFTGTAPKTFDEMMAISPPSGSKLFCVGLSSGDASGWPATDMLDNIIMRQSSDKTYNDWIAGKVKWTDPAIKKGFQTYLKMVTPATVYGGPSTVLSTPFGDAGKPLFTSPPGCLFLEQATFITNFFTQNNPSLKAGTDFDFFPHPSIDSQYDGNVNGFADNFVLYNNNSAAKELMKYMSTKEAQQIWVNDGGTLAARKDITSYPDPIFKHAAEVALSAKNLLVTAGDFMPADMQHAFWKAMLDVTKTPSSLDSVLSRLDQVQKAAYSS